MAQKKGLIYRLTMGKDNLPDFTPDRLPGTRFQLFKDVFFNRIGALVKINLLVLLFCLPAIAWVVLMQFIKQADGSLLPYSGNVGIGYPIVNDVVTLGQQRAFQFDLQTYLILIPCIMIASIGLSGAFYVIRRLSWGEGISVASHFFQGIKMNFLPFLWSSLFAGVSLFLVLANIGIYNNMPEIHIAWHCRFGDSVCTPVQHARFFNDAGGNVQAQNVGAHKKQFSVCYCIVTHQSHHTDIKRHTRSASHDSAHLYIGVRLSAFCTHRIFVYYFVMDGVCALGIR